MKKIGKKILIFWIVSFFFFTVIYLPINVYADAVYITVETFDTYSEGVNNGTNAYNIWNGSPYGSYYSKTSTDEQHSGSMSLKQHGGTVYSNFTMSINYEIGGFYVWIYAYGYADNTVDKTANCYLYDNESNKFIDFKIVWHKTKCNIYVYDYDGYISLYETSADETWYKIGFQGNHTVGNPDNYVYYYVKNASGGLLASVEKRWIGLYEYDNPVLGYIYLTRNLQDTASNFYWDDLTIDTEEYTDTGGSTQVFCNGELDGFITDTALKGYQYLETNYIDDTGLGLDGNITQVRLPISIEQYDISNNVSDYILRVNGFDCGASDYFITSDYPGYYYWLVWNNLQVEIINNNPVFSFGYTGSKYLGYYWYEIPHFTNTFKPFYYHNDSSKYANTIKDGYAYLDAGFPTSYQDIYFCFLVENFEYQNDTIPDTPDDFVNTSLFFNFYDARTGNRLEFIDYDYYYSIKLNPWQEGGLFNGWENNYCVISALSITAISDGGNETHVYESATSDWFSSGSTVSYQNVRISPGGSNIVDFMGSSQGNIKGYVDGEGVLYYRYIRTETLYPLHTYNVYLVRLGDSNDTGELTPSENQTYHDLYGDFFLEFADDDSCAYRVGSKPTLVYYLNDSLYSDLNGYIFEIKNIDGNTTFYRGFIYEPYTEYGGKITIQKRFSVTGQYNILVYNVSSTNNKDELVYQSKLTITVCDQLPSGGDTGGDWFGMPFWLPYLIGIFITLFITISPLVIAIYVSRKTHATTLPNIPGLLYVGFFFMGLTVSVMMSFLPSWLPFVILFGMVVYFAIQWLYGKKETTQGE